jgi:hypothetical protein
MTAALISTDDMTNSVPAGDIVIAGSTASFEYVLDRISRKAFWESMYFAPIKRMGYSKGPGAMFHGEPHTLRCCRVTGENVYTRMAHFVLATADEEGAYYECRENVTLEEFKAMCACIIPGTGPCEGGYGKDL